MTFDIYMYIRYIIRLQNSIYLIYRILMNQLFSIDVTAVCP